MRGLLNKDDWQIPQKDRDKFWAEVYELYGGEIDAGTWFMASEVLEEHLEELVDKKNREILKANKSVKINLIKSQI